MSNANDVFKRVTDATGEDYYCPLGAKEYAAGQPDADECVEASTVERYSGNLKKID